MRLSGLVVVVGALAVLGYAIYSLATAGGDRPAAAEPSSAVEADKPKARRARPRVAPGGVAPAPVTRVGDARRRGGPPPRPEPTVSLEKAREDFADLLAEFDRIEAKGTVLTNEEWTGHYKDGHEALQPLLQHLEWTNPTEADELRQANEDLRMKLQAIDPNRGTPPPELSGP